MSLADVGFAPDFTRLTHLRPHRMFDDKCLSLMTEKGEEYWPGIKAALAA